MAEHGRRIEEVLDPAFFKALADPNRRTLVARLARERGPSTVSEVAECCPVDLSVVSRHLAVLRDAGVVHAEKHGREVRYRIEHAVVARRLRELADAIETCCIDDECCSRPDKGATP